MLLHKQRGVGEANFRPKRRSSYQIKGAGEANFRSHRRSSYQSKGEVLLKRTVASNYRYIIDKGRNIDRSVPILMFNMIY